MLERDELILLEDCLDDWQGLWEAGWSEINEPVDDRAALVTRLVQRRLLNVLRLNAWSEVSAAAALPREEALLVAQDVGNYAAPGEGFVGHFYVLSISPEGKAAQEDCYN